MTPSKPGLYISKLLYSRFAMLSNYNRISICNRFSFCYLATTRNFISSYKILWYS